MCELPRARFTPARSFASVAVDYAGPFELKDGKTRTKKLIKAYICVFICLGLKAVHIEVISDLSTEGFLSVLTRFVSRRGLCSDIYSAITPQFLLAAIMN